MDFRICAVLLILFAFALCSAGVWGREPGKQTDDSLPPAAAKASAAVQPVPENAVDSAHPYDAELAKQLGADEYGMRSYVFVLLKTGKVTIQDKAESRKIFAGHFANMSRLAKEGKLVLAGPFIDGEPKRGLFVFDVATIEEAEKIVKTDPAVQAGVFDYELTKLYCSAALRKIHEIHETVQKSKIENSCCHPKAVSNGTHPDRLSNPADKID